MARPVPQDSVPCPDRLRSADHLQYRLHLLDLLYHLCRKTTLITMSDELSFCYKYAGHVSRSISQTILQQTTQNVVIIHLLRFTSFCERITTYCSFVERCRPISSRAVNYDDDDDDDDEFHTEESQLQRSTSGKPCTIYCPITHSNTVLM